MMTLEPFLGIESYNMIPEEGCHYDHMSGIMTGTQEIKAGLFESQKKLQYIGHNEFICKPLGKNVQCHTLKKDEHGEWHCSCQWNTKKQKTCSHIMGLFLSFKNKSFGDAR
jgi:hypothetical protein